MKRNLFVFIFVFFGVISSNCQEIKVFLYLKNPCNNSVNRLDLFELKNDSKTFLYNSIVDSVPLLLKDTGIYFLRTQFISGDVVLKINKYGIYLDTLTQSKINEFITVDKTPAFRGWICCDVKCDGYQVDYFINGNKRIEGTFKKGKPLGELKFYNMEGTLAYIEYYSKRGKFINRKDIQEVKGINK